MFYAIVVVIALILDQMMKYWAVINVPENTGTNVITQKLIPGFIHLTNYHNQGAAFGFLQNVSWARWFFVVLCAIFVLAVVYVLARNIVTSPGARWAAVIVVAGAIGNCVDRVISGYVVDMLEFDFLILGRNFPIFNIADIYITLGVIAFCLFTLLEKPAAGAGKQPETTEARTHVSAPANGTVSQFPEQLPKAPEKSAGVKYQDVVPPEPKPEPKPAPIQPVVVYTQPKQPVKPAQAVPQPVREESKPAPAPVKASEPVQPAQKPAPAQPRQQPETPASAPAQSTSDEFDLESILAEFRDL